MGFGSILSQIFDFRAKQWIQDTIKCCHWARTTNIGLLYRNVRNNIGGDPIDVPPIKILEGMCPRHPRRRWRQCSTDPAQYQVQDMCNDWCNLYLLITVTVGATSVSWFSLSTIIINNNNNNNIRHDITVCGRPAASNMLFREQELSLQNVLSLSPVGPSVWNSLPADLKSYRFCSAFNQ